ncbi:MULTISPECIES: PEP-CTERM sorting domain-containing protein [Microcoleaceae]|uniref:PEP-CTERM sorting domain-containing protein n=1 Tax=Microcoleaceae TaxID=1892252 RepID=UPI001D15A425|nr:PEP-CTERM sorting domain-containing protein [Tychonema sp. LEGE 06208]
MTNIIIHDRYAAGDRLDTAAEPVPEPLTVGGTALGLAGLSWLKHKKKMAA